MCYFIHGAAFGKIDADEYEKVAAKHELHFKIGTKHDVKKDMSNGEYEYLVTNHVCDCESPVASKDASAPELKEYEALLNDLMTVRGLKHIYLCKVWDGNIQKREAKVKLQDINIPEFLANAENDCLYTFEIQ